MKGFIERVIRSESSVCLLLTCLWFVCAFPGIYVLSAFNGTLITFVLKHFEITILPLSKKKK